MYCKTSHSVAVFLYVANRNQKLIAAPSRTCLFLLKSEIKHSLKKKKKLEREFLLADASDDLQDKKKECGLGGKSPRNHLRISISQLEIQPTMNINKGEGRDFNKGQIL